MIRLTNQKNSEHVLAGFLKNGFENPGVVIQAGQSVELSDEDFARWDGPALRGMVAAGELALNAVEVEAPKKPNPSNAPARDLAAEAETADLLANIKKAKK